MTGAAHSGRGEQVREHIRAVLKALSDRRTGRAGPKSSTSGASSLRPRASSAPVPSS